MAYYWCVVTILLLATLFCLFKDLKPTLIGALLARRWIMKGHLSAAGQEVTRCGGWCIMRILTSVGFVCKTLRKLALIDGFMLHLLLVLLMKWLLLLLSVLVLSMLLLLLSLTTD